jgi:hypothetical protein
MKSYSEFLKEEIDLKGNTGIPDDLTTNADRQAVNNLGIQIDSRTSESEIGPQLGRLVSQGMDFMFQGIPPQQIMAMFHGRGPVPQQLEDKYIKLEQLAKKIILDQYSDILDASEKPIVLDIKMLRPGKQVSSEIPEMKDVPSFPSQEEINDPELRKAVDKKKILNVINQGEAKATKNIIKDRSIVEDGLREIFGNNWETIYNIWLQTTDMANKLDWASPIEVKSKMMKDAQQFMAGSCQVKWEKEEEEAQEEDNEEEAQEENSYQDEDGTLMTGDQEDFDKITIKAVGIDFPMLIHEAVKGIWSLIKSGAIKDDEEMAKLIAQNTSSFEDESQDFRYGVAIQAMFRDFINACKDSDKYSQMRLRVYAKLSLDKERGGDFTDGEFLELTKSMFSCFDLVQEANLEFNLNIEKFNSSTAKRQIEGLITGIVNVEKEYEKQLSEWEMDKKFSDESSDEYSKEDEDDFDNFLSDVGISRAKQETPTTIEDETYSDEDLSNMRQRDIQELIDDALENGDYKEVGRLSKFLKEGAEIYLREVERINELHTRRK